MVCASGFFPEAFVFIDYRSVFIQSSVLSRPPLPKPARTSPWFRKSLQEIPQLLSNILQKG